MDVSLRIADDPGPGRYRAPRESRALAAVLSLGIAALIVLALLSMAVLRDEGRAGGALLTALNLSPPPGAKTPSPAKARAAASAASPTQTTQATQPPKLLPRVPMANPNTVEWPDNFVHISHADMAAADIGTIHSSASSGTASASAGGGANGGGEGPGGSHLYNAAWYREPRDAELAGYMRPGQSTGRWAEIACRTIDAYHVEDCHELAESPQGSGMAHVLRQAAWQFLVRPPRVDGKVMVGTWVRIHFDFTKGKAEQSAE